MSFSSVWLVLCLGLVFFVGSVSSTFYRLEYDPHAWTPRFTISRGLDPTRVYEIRQDNWSFNKDLYLYDVRNLDRAVAFMDIKAAFSMVVNLHLYLGSELNDPKKIYLAHMEQRKDASNPQDAIASLSHQYLGIDVSPLLYSQMPIETKLQRWFDAAGNEMGELVKRQSESTMLQMRTFGEDAGVASQATQTFSNQINVKLRTDTMRWDIEVGGTDPREQMGHLLVYAYQIRKFVRDEQIREQEKNWNEYKKAERERQEREAAQAKNDRQER